MIDKKNQWNLYFSEMEMKNNVCMCVNEWMKEWLWNKKIREDEYIYIKIESVNNK